MLRLLFWGIVIYVLYKIFSFFYRIKKVLKTQKDNIYRRERKDVVDVDYEEVESNDKKS